MGAAFSCYPEEGTLKASFWICYGTADGPESDRKLGETFNTESSSQNSVVSDGTLAQQTHQQSAPVSHFSFLLIEGKEHILWSESF